MQGNRIVFIVAFWMLGLTAMAGEDLDSRLREAALPTTPAARLMQLAHDPDWRVRKAVASQQRAPASVLNVLASDKDARVRAALAHNLRAPVKATMSLVRDPSEDVRYSLAHCGYTDPSVLEKLIDDPSERVRLQLILNPNLPITALERMAREKGVVGERARRMLEQRRKE